MFSDVQKFRNFTYFAVKLYHCVNYSVAEQQDIDNGTEEEIVCEVDKLGRVFTQGRNSSYFPGCHGPGNNVCMCCEGRYSLCCSNEHKSFIFYFNVAKHFHTSPALTLFTTPSDELKPQ